MAQARATRRATGLAFSRAVGLKPSLIEHARHGSKCNRTGHEVSWCRAYRPWRTLDWMEQRQTEHDRAVREINFNLETRV